MMRPGWWLLRLLAHALEPAERDAALGDVSESGQGLYSAIWDILGLIVRRQAGLWAAWGPWLALIGISGIAGVPLSRIAFRFNVALGQQLMAHRKYGVHFETGLTPGQDMAFLLCLAGALVVWSWACGFALGSLSGRAVWITWPVFYLVVLNSAWAIFVLSGNIILRDPRPLRLILESVQPLRIETLFFALPALHGSIWGMRRRTLTRRSAYLLAAAVTFVTTLTTWTSGWYESAHEAWSGGVWLGVAWPTRLLPFLLVSWPAVYLFAKTYRQHTHQRETI